MFFLRLGKSLIKNIMVGVDPQDFFSLFKSFFVDKYKSKHNRIMFSKFLPELLEFWKKFIFSKISHIVVCGCGKFLMFIRFSMSPIFLSFDSMD